MVVLKFQSKSQMVVRSVFSRALFVWSSFIHLGQLRACVLDLLSHMSTLEIIFALETVTSCRE